MTTDYARTITHACCTSLALLAAVAQAASAAPPPIPAAERHRVFHAGAVHGALGTFSGPRDRIGLAMVEDVEYPLSGDVLRATFELSSNGWAGLFFVEGRMGDDRTIDLSDYAKAGALRFWIKTEVDVQVGVRSGNIAPGRERSKLWLAKENLADPDGEWQLVRIPLSRFAELDGRLRFDQVAVPFVAAVDHGSSQADSGSFEIADVSWCRTSATRFGEGALGPRGTDLAPLRTFNLPEFSCYDGIGRWCSLSGSTLSFGIRRPSSGSDRTAFDLATGTITRRWDVMGLGHGNQTVRPINDGRYAQALRRFATHVASWVDRKIPDYGPEDARKLLPTESRDALRKTAAALEQLLQRYPTGSHAAETDLEWRTDDNGSVVRIWAEAPRAVTMEVVYELRTTADDGEARKPSGDSVAWSYRGGEYRPFLALLHAPPNVYDEARAEAELERLERRPMTRRVDGRFEGSVELQGFDRLRYVLIAKDADGRATVIVDKPCDARLP